jgi:hypothetical protein
VIIGIRSLPTVGIWDYMIIWLHACGNIGRAAGTVIRSSSPRFFGRGFFFLRRSSEERGEEVLLSSVATTTYYL